VITGNSYPVFPPETSEYETSNINFGEIAVNEGQEIVKTTTEEDAYYDFGTTRVKFKVKDQNGNFLYLTFKDGTIVVSAS
jgi:penicillin V acylase-like amidase (Ntn superfamily)